MKEIKWRALKKRTFLHDRIGCSTIGFFKNVPITMAKPATGMKTYMDGILYRASKQAVLAFSNVICMEILPHRIHVGQIPPSFPDTEFSVVRYKGNEEKAKQVYKWFKVLKVEDIARAALFILESPSHICINDLEITPTAQTNA